ncbi:MAG: hypothetical protein ABI746_09065 [Dermatophilaceae bacterium]
MSASPHSTSQAVARPDGPRQIRVLLYSDNRSIRDAVRLAVGRRPSRGVEVSTWFECATPAAAEEGATSQQYDLLILDGESAPFGGLGMCRQFKHEIFECPPIIVLTGRPQDDWLAAWSYADGAVPHPIDPIAMAKAVAQVAEQAPVRPY